MISLIQLFFMQNMLQIWSHLESQSSKYKRRFITGSFLFIFFLNLFIIIIFHDLCFLIAQVWWFVYRFSSFLIKNPITCLKISLYKMTSPTLCFKITPPLSDRCLLLHPYIIWFVSVSLYQAVPRDFIDWMRQFYLCSYEQYLIPGLAINLSLSSYLSFESVNQDRWKPLARFFIFLISSLDEFKNPLSSTNI